MIIFLYGEDTYRSRQKLNEIIAHYQRVHTSGLNIRFLDCSEKDSVNIVFAQLKEGIQQTSMFEEKKLQVVKSPFLNPEFREKFSEEAENFTNSKDIVLIYQAGKADERTSLFKSLKKYAKCQEFKPLQGQQLKNWIKKELAIYEADIEPMALEKLVEYVGDDLWRMAGEIKKLVNFNQQTIKIQDIEILVKPKIDTDIFKTIDAIARKDKKQALQLLHKHLEQGDSPLYLLSMINFQFRNLLIVKELIEQQKSYDIILRKSGLHPFVVKKSYFQSQKFTFPELKKIYQNIFKVDYDIKTGRIEPETALDLLIAEI